MTIYENINALVSYALSNSLIQQEDTIYTQNRLLELFHLDGFPSSTPSISNAPSMSDFKTQNSADFLETTLSEMLDYAAQNGIFEDTGIVSRDLFDTKIMGMLVPPPSTVIGKFRELQNTKGTETATNWFYKFSCDSDYIRRYRISKDLKWKTKTEYGELDISINLSKPEKDPKAIAAAMNDKNTKYPSCLLCKENEGYAGRLNHAARQNHRIIPLKLAGEDWFFQYSPYVYYNEHCIVFSSKHEPMKIERKTFERLLDFITQFPHYTLGSNADIPIVGGSILTHNHFQGGRFEFPMAKAPLEYSFTMKNFPTIEAGIVNWPMSVIRLNSNNKEELVDAADSILKEWRSYSDESVYIFAETNGERHNTITPIARRRGQSYELDLVLRNNITSEKHPLGVFHPHAELHHIKKENIGLIEVMGLAILPSRLKQELIEIREVITKGTDLRNNEKLAKHADWVESLDKNNMDLEREIGFIFKKVLEDAGVFKRTIEGKKAFIKFVSNL